MRVGGELLELARRADAPTIFIVGIGRDVGKTTTLKAIYSAAPRSSEPIGVASIGREGAGFSSEAQRKPRIWLRPGTAFVTARSVLPRSPAVEILKLSHLQSPAGRLLYARAVTAGFYELVGPPTASGVREMMRELGEMSARVIIDGAVDRVASVAGFRGAIVVACGAAAATTVGEAVDEVTALVARLSVPEYDSNAAAIEIEGALTGTRVAALLAVRETRQVVVRDPTQIALGGKAATRAVAQLKIRCRRPVQVVAVTVASIGPQRSFEPRAFAKAVSAATRLPVYDVYAGFRAA